MTVAIALALLVLAPQAQQQQSDMEFLGERARTSALLEIEGEGEGRIRLRFPWDETAPQRLSLPAATSPRAAAETRLPVILRHRERAATATCGPAATREAATHNRCLNGLRPALAPDAAAARDYLDARCALGAGLGAVRLSVGDTVILDLPRARLACDDEGFTLLGPAGSASRLRIER